jgi:hypothetical protein
MKNLLIKNVLTCALVLATSCFCAQKKVVSPAKKEVVVPVKMISLDLSSKGINASIQVPEGVAIIPNEYEIIIGNGKDILIKIEEAYETYDQKKEFVKTNDVRGFKQFIIQNSSSFIAEMNPMGMGAEFDFVYFTTIDGKNYFLQDQGSERHKDLKVIEIMLLIAQSIKEN